MTPNGSISTAMNMDHKQGDHGTVRRIFVDVTFTRHQGQAIGITRVVRRLEQEFKQLITPTGGKCHPVTFHPMGYRHASDPVQETEAGDRLSPPPRLVGFIDLNRMLRKPVSILVKTVPWSFLYPIWYLGTSLVESLRSRKLVPVQFQPGDLLVIADVAWGYPSWRAASMARKAGARVVTVVHDLMPIRRPQYCYELIPYLYGRWLEKSVSISNRIACVSAATASDLKNWLEEVASDATNREKVDYFFLGTDFRARKVSQDQVRSELKKFMEAKAACFAMIGTFEPKKNHELIWNAVTALWSEGHEFSLLLVGGVTKEAEELLARIRSSNTWQDRVQLIHDATDAEIDFIYENARTLVMASEFEGYGLPLVEARARGCPVIASRIPPFVELADEGVHHFSLSEIEELKIALIEDIRSNRRNHIEPAPVKTWKESANELLRIAYIDDTQER